jgi:squalene-hopene/tetraprenyl-beta-curcumene cyclase
VDAVETQRGVEFLLGTQKPDGSWDEEHFTGTGFPGVFYLRYHLYRVYFPLFALAYYRNIKEGVPSPGGPGRIALPPRRPRSMELMRKVPRRGLFGKTR